MSNYEERYDLDSDLEIDDFSSMSSSDDDEDDEEEEVQQNEISSDKTPTKGTDEDEKEFLQDYRMSKEIVNYVSYLFKKSPHYNQVSGKYGKISAQNQVRIFLWFAGHQNFSFREISDKFHVSLSSLHRVIRRVGTFLSCLSAEVISWPNEIEKKEIERTFRRRGFPGVMGVVGRCHINISKPQHDAIFYLNGNGCYSLQIHVVCDHKMKILDLFLGYPESDTGCKEFRDSVLFSELDEKCGKYYLLGDRGYPLRKNLLKPYRDNGILTNQQLNFNKKLYQNLRIVEQCFRTLKQKFEQLAHVKLRELVHIAHFIRACCILHNLSLDDDFNIEENIFVHNIILEPDICDNDEFNEEDDIAAEVNRDYVAKTIYSGLR